jgi:hypothetical protein
MSYSRKGEKGYLSLEGGLVTESSPLASEEGTTSDELNMTIDITSLVRKPRLGAELLASEVSYSGEINNAFYWKAGEYIVLIGISDNVDEDLSTVDIMFHDPDDYSRDFQYEFHVLTSNVTIGSLNEIRNRLQLTFGTKPFVFQKEPSGNLSAWELDLYIRDFKLVDDTLSIGERPTTLSDEHKYNLYNAGWYRDRQLESGGVGDPISDFNTKLSEYPSNADIVYLGDVPNTNGVPVFNPDVLQNLDVGNSEAPRGHYVYNITNINRTSKLIDKEEDGTPSTTLTQVLDDGTNVSGNSGNILFIEDAQANDPVDPYIPPYKPGGLTP